MKLKKLTMAMVSALLAASMMAGCGASEGGSSSDGGTAAANADGTAAAASSGGRTAGSKDTLVILSAENFLGNWDPTGHTALSQLHAEWICYNRLIHMDTDTQELSPELALSWEYIDDATLQLKLREGVKFQDGTDFDADDVKATLEKHSSKDSVTTAWWSQPVKVEVVDQYTVNVQMEDGSPYSGLINMLCMVPVMSADDIADPSVLSSRLNGTGAYKFDKYENDTIYYSAFEDCWEGAPKTPYVQYKYVADSSTRLAALQTGEADIIERVESEQVSVLESNPDTEVITQLTTELKHLFFKFEVEPMNEELVRKAISYAIDRETIVNDILQGYGQVADCYVSSTVWGYSPVEGFPTYDPEYAAELLAEAGYPNGEGLPELTYTTSVGFYVKTKEYGEFITANLQALGLNVKFNPVETATWNDMYYQATPCTMIDGGWCPPGLEPDLKLNPFYRSPGLITKFVDSELDAVMDKEAAELDSEKRKAILSDEVYPLLVEKCEDVPLFNSMAIFGVGSNVEGFKALPTTSFEVKNAVKS
ncbi:MAG: ABC transporter substrate-binding protein [Oscillospiraceae bacterium]